MVGAERPDTTFTFLGRTFDTPIMTAALSHLDLVGMAEGARQAGAPVSVGMGENEELGEILATGAQVMKVIKPYADENEVLRRIAYAEAHGAMAVGIDIEHSVNAEDDQDSVVLDLQMKLPTIEVLKKYLQSTKLPFFIKGAMSAQDAVRLKEMGFAGIIMSHHNGLLRCAVPPAKLLPQVRAAVGKDFILIIDGGIESGFDAFKALALGADCVTVGRKLMPPLKDNGAEGVRDTILKMNGQLKALMLRTGIKDLAHMDSSVLHECI